MTLDEPIRYTHTDGSRFELREPEPGDETEIGKIMADWPDDGSGGYTPALAVVHVTEWKRENARVPVPLPAPDPVILSLIFTRDDAVIGLVRFAFWHYTCVIINEAIKRKERGNGYSDILHEMQFALVPILQPRKVKVHALKTADAAAVDHYFETKFVEASKVGDVVSDLTGRALTEYEYDVDVALPAREKNPDVADRVAIAKATEIKVDPVTPPTLAELAPPEPPAPDPDDFEIVIEPVRLFDLGGERERKRLEAIERGELVEIETPIATVDAAPDPENQAPDAEPVKDDSSPDS